MSFKVAILGGGTVAELLAGRLPATCRKVIIDPAKARAVALADEVGGVATDQVTAVRGCQVVFLTAPGAAAEPILAEAAPHVDPGTLVVNSSPGVSTAQLAELSPRLKLAGARVLGSPRAMSQGIPGVVALDLVDPDDEERLRWLLDGLGPITRADESRIAEIESTADEVLRSAESTLRSRLTELGLGREMAERLVIALCPDLPRPVTIGGSRTV